MNRARVLIVEDDQIIAYLIEKLVKMLGHEPLGPVAYGEGVAAAVNEHRPDLILVDIMLKGEVDGIMAVEEVRRSHDVPVIFITGNSDRATIERAMATGPAEYLEKPIIRAKFDEAVNNALNGRPGRSAAG